MDGIAEQRRVDDVLHSLGDVRDGLLPRQDVGEAAPDRHDAERHHEGRQPEQVDEQSREEADSPPGRDREGDGGRDRQVLQRQAQDDARQPRDRSDREVDAARQDHEGHADRHDADHHGLIQHIEDVGARQEVGRQQRQTDRQQQGQTQHPDFEPPRQRCRERQLTRRCNGGASSWRTFLSRHTVFV